MWKDLILNISEFPVQKYAIERKTAVNSFVVLVFAVRGLTLFPFYKNIKWFVRPRLNISIFLPILDWKYFCNILIYSLYTAALEGRLKIKLHGHFTFVFYMICSAQIHYMYRSSLKIWLSLVKSVSFVG